MNIFYFHKNFIELNTTHKATEIFFIWDSLFFYTLLKEEIINECQMNFKGDPAQKILYSAPKIPYPMVFFVPEMDLPEFNRKI